MAKGLTAKQRAFIAFYVETWNATEAAKLAGYKGNYATLRSIASENLTKPNIQAEINKRFQKMAMGADEALARLAAQARGVDFAKVSEAIKVSDGTESLDMPTFLQNVHELGLGFHIKSVKETRHGLNIEFYDAQAALFKVLQVLGLLKEHVVVEDWRQVAVKEIQQGNIQFKNLVDALGDRNLALDLFRQAGVPVVLGKD